MAQHMPFEPSLRHGRRGILSEQYQDGTFGDVKPLPDKLKELLEMIPERQAKLSKVHIGTPEEIETARRNAMQEIAKLKGIRP